MAPTATTDPQALLAHLDFVRGLARSLLFDHTSADDVVQQAWLRASRQPPRTGAVRGFLARVTRNVAANLRRGERRRAAHERAAARPEPLPSTSEIVAREEMRNQVVRAVLALEEPYRGVVLLRWFEDLTPQQIAERLGIPAGTVRTRIFRALEQLRARLDRQHGGERRPWALALVPLAREAVPGEAVLASTAWVKTVLVAAACLVFGVFVVPRLVDLATGGEAGESQGVVAAPARSTPAREPPTPAVASEGQRAAASAPSGLAGFRGRLIDPAGRPAADRLVKLLAVDPASLYFVGCDPLAATPRRLALRPTETRSGRDGRFEITGVPPRGFYVLRAAIDSDWPTTRFLDRTPGRGEMVELGDVQLVAGAIVTGRVLDETGAPLAGANVLVFDLPAALAGAVPLPALGGDAHALLGELGVVVSLPCSLGDLLATLPIGQARTAADGTFAVAGVAAGQSTLLVQAAGRPDLVRGGLRVIAGERLHAGDLRSSAGASIEGRVVDAAGQPVAGADVLLAPVGIVSAIAFTRAAARTDAAGRFVVEGLPRGRLAAAVRRGATDGWTLLPPQPFGRELRVVLPERVDLHLDVAGEDGAPVAGVRCKLMPGTARGELCLSGFTPGVPLAARQTVAARGQILLRDVDAVPCTLLVGAEGHALARLEVDPAKQRQLEVRLRKASPVTVVVVDGEGRPVSGAVISGRSSPEAAWERTLLPHWSSFPCWRILPRDLGRTDAEGRLLVRELPSAHAVLAAAHPAHGRQSQLVELPSSEVRLVLQATGAVAGRVLVATGEPGAWAIGVERARPHDVEARYDVPRWTVPDAEGRFRVDGLEPGVYRVEAYPAFRSVGSLGAARAYLDRDLFEDWRFGESAVKVEAGSVAEVTIDTARGLAKTGQLGVRVFGRVRVDGRPEAGCVVRFGRFLGQRRGQPADAEGRFDLGQLEPGATGVTIEATTEAGEVSLLSRQLELVVGHDVELDVELRTGSLEGVVHGPDGRPLPGVRVVADGQREPSPAGARAEGAWCLVTTGEGGRFRFPRLPAGRYSIEVGDRERGIGKVAATVDAGTTAAVTVALAAVYRLAGRVDLAAAGLGEGESVALSARDQARQAVTGAAIDDQGRFDLPGLLPARYELSLSVTGKRDGGGLGWRSIELGEVEIVDRDQVGLELRPVVSLKKQE